MYLYADEDYYVNEYGGGTIQPEDLKKSLRRASRHIDALTHNRIVGRGFDKLTDFQQDIVREVCCEMADFEYENAEMLECVLQNYGINGVTMDFGNSWNVKVLNGVAVRADIYAELSQTGLCCKIIG